MLDDDPLTNFDDDAASLFYSPSPPRSSAVNRLKTGFVLVYLLPAYLTFAVFKHILPLPWLARWAWRSPAKPRDRDAERQLAGSVLRLSQITVLSDRDCLQRSLLLYHVLSRAGADPTLVIGFERVKGRVQGHAWVTIDGVPVFESKDALAPFMPAFGFGVGGTLLRVLNADGLGPANGQ